ncbi:Inosine-5'-monophosphate dehydrogenase [Candidatus Entotheonellaceae bacterium PAL068K]
MQVKDLMSRDVFALYADDSLTLAEEMMHWKRIRHVPVVDRHYDLKGIVTHRDILQASISTIARLSRRETQEIQTHIRLQDIMRTSVFTITPEADIKEAAGVMLREKIGCLLVAEQGHLVGILTEADFLKYVLQREAEV